MKSPNFRSLKVVFWLLLASLGGWPPASWGQSTPRPEFVWSPVTTAAGPTTCFFRKKFTLVNPEQGELLIAATGPYTVYLNGKKFGSGEANSELVKLSIGEQLRAGTNTLAVQVDSNGPVGNGLSIRLRVKETNEVRWRALTTDGSWLTHQESFENWFMPTFRDTSWLPAAGVTPRFAATALNADSRAAGTVSVLVDDTSNSESSSTEPQLPGLPAPRDQRTAPTRLTAGSNSPPMSGNPLQPRKVEKTSNNSGVAASPRTPGPDGPATTQPQFQLPTDFRIDPIMSGEETGSIIAMAFNEFGQLIFSREGGHLMIADMTLPIGTNRVVSLCEQVENCQGILPLNGKVYVTGSGPEGVGIYVLERTNAESVKMTVSQTLFRFRGEMGEHGPHGLTLGPDGMIYCIVGNGSGLPEGVSCQGPYQFPYDVDLRARWEDPSGHANGIKAPGGVILRFALDGSQPQVVAGGIRNSYDLAFNKFNDLFLHDSDMESDVGLPWYRPTALYHVVEGADLGWRSGWAKFPYYYFDTLPPVAQTGRGSPTGAVCYNHLAFPARYHGALFLADWSEGRVLAVHQTRAGGSYESSVEEFLTGKPLNVTDLDIGEDGSLYLATGGRGTSGGVYRVSWTGEIPPAVAEFEDEITKLLRHPQPEAAWARQNKAVLVSQTRFPWQAELEKVALDPQNTAAIRCQAIENLYLFGLLNNRNVAQQLLSDSDELVRSKACYQYGLNSEFATLCLPLLSDSSPWVQRKAAEAAVRHALAVPTEQLQALVNSGDRSLQTVATRLLNRQSTDELKSRWVTSDKMAEVAAGSLTLLRREPNLVHSYDVLVRCSQMMDSFMNDHDFMTLLRTVQIALTRSQVDPTKISGFAEKIAAEFPTTSPPLNRELIRVLAYLESTESANRFLEYLQGSTDDDQTKILVAMYLASYSNRFEDELKLAIIDNLHKLLQKNEGGSYRLYLANSIRQTTENLSDKALSRVLKNGAEWPYALVPTFYRLQASSYGELAPTLIELDRGLKPLANQDVVAQARLGIIALLAEGRTEAGNQYLRELWKSEPNRRNDLVIGLAQTPSPENWTYLIASLNLVDDLTAKEVLEGIRQVPLRPVAPRHYRELLELGYRLKGPNALTVSEILATWAKESQVSANGDWQTQLATWTTWYHERWPEETAVNTSSDAPTIANTVTLKLWDQLNSGTLSGDPERGRLVFTQANCAKCHRFGTTGDSSGPDLTSLASRFSKRETFEALAEPSKVVADRYQSTLILNEHGVTFTGLKVDNGDGSISLIQSNGERVRFQLDEIVEQKKVTKSSMPEDLLTAMSPQDVADLFAFLYNERGGNTAQQSPQKLK